MKGLHIVSAFQGSFNDSRGQSFRQRINILTMFGSRHSRENIWTSHEVPPPPLYIYWQSIGEAVFKTKFRSKHIVVDDHGQLDARASLTPFFFQKFVQNPSTQSYVDVAKEVTRVIKEVDARFKSLESIYPEIGLAALGSASYGQ